MIDMLVLGALDTLKQGQRSCVMGIKDLWENSEDKSKAWQNERLSFWKGNEKSYLLFCPDWMFFVGKVVAEGKSKKKEESTVFSSCFLFILFPQSQDRIPKRISALRAALHIKPIQNHIERTWRWCAAGRWRGSIFTSSRIEVWWGGPAELETTSWARSQQVLGKLLCYLRFFRWKTWRCCAPFIYGGYQD